MAHIDIYTKLGCPYCDRARALLRERGVTQLNEVRIDLQPDQRPVMITRAGGRTTVPQIFIDGQHIGGCDDLVALDQRGGLSPLLGA